MKEIYKLGTPPQYKPTWGSIHSFVEIDCGEEAMWGTGWSVFGFCWRGNGWGGRIGGRGGVFFVENPGFPLRTPITSAYGAFANRHLGVSIWICREITMGCTPQITFGSASYPGSGFTAICPAIYPAHKLCGPPSYMDP